MPSLARVAAVAAVICFLPGCGGSSHASTGTGTTVTATSPATSPLPGTTTSTSSTTHAASVATTSGSGSAGVTTPGTGGAGLGPAAVPTGATRSPAGGVINARVPALFTLSARGTLSPGQVSVPAFLAVAIRITSASPSPHTVLVEIPHAVRLAVAPRGTSLTTIGGLRAGTYPILVDGARRAALVIGGEPGP